MALDGIFDNNFFSGVTITVSGFKQIICSKLMTGPFKLNKASAYRLYVYPAINLLFPKSALHRLTDCWEVIF